MLYTHLNEIMIIIIVIAIIIIIIQKSSISIWYIHVKIVGIVQLLTPLAQFHWRRIWTRQNWTERNSGRGYNVKFQTDKKKHTGKYNNNYKSIKNQERSADRAIWFRCSGLNRPAMCVSVCKWLCLKRKKSGWSISIQSGRWGAGWECMGGGVAGMKM